LAAPILKQETEGVAVSGHGGRADIALPHQVILEIALNPLAEVRVFHVSRVQNVFRRPPGVPAAREDTSRYRGGDGGPNSARGSATAPPLLGGWTASAATRGRHGYDANHGDAEDGHGGPAFGAAVRRPRAPCSRPGPGLARKGRDAPRMERCADGADCTPGAAPGRSDARPPNPSGGTCCRGSGAVPFGDPPPRFLAPKLRRYVARCRPTNRARSGKSKGEVGPAIGGRPRGGWRLAEHYRIKGDKGVWPDRRGG